MEVLAEVTGNVWKVVVEPGQSVGEGDTLVILESMKMEIPVTAPSSCVIDEVRVAEGGQVVEGEVVAVVTAA